MLTTIDSVKRAARKGKVVLLDGLAYMDKVNLMKSAGFPTNAGTMYVSGFNGKTHYLKHVRG